MRYYLTLARKAIIKKNKRQTFARMWRNWKPCTLLVGMQNSEVAMENSVAGPQKIKTRTNI